MDLFNVVLELAVVLLVGFSALIGWLVRRLFQKMDELEIDMKGFKQNYLDRFEKAREHRFEMETNLTAILNKIDKKLDVHIAKDGQNTKENK